MSEDDYYAHPDGKPIRITFGQGSQPKKIVHVATYSEALTIMAAVCRKLLPVSTWEKDIATRNMVEAMEAHAIHGNWHTFATGDFNVDVRDIAAARQRADTNASPWATRLKQ